MIRFEALTIQLNDLRDRFTDSRYNSPYGEIWRAANYLFYTIKKFPEAVRTEYIEDMVNEKFQELQKLLEAVDLDDADAIAESKLEGKERLTDESILSKDEFQKLLNKAFVLDDHGLDVFDWYEEDLIAAANTQDREKLDSTIQEIVKDLLHICHSFIWDNEADKLKAIATIEDNSQKGYIEMTTNDSSTDTEFDYQLNVLAAAAEAGDAETAKAWLQRCAELDAIAEPNDNLRKAVQALSDAGMLFNANDGEPFYTTPGAKIELPKKSFTLTEDEMNELIAENFEVLTEADLFDTTGSEDDENLYHFEKTLEWSLNFAETPTTVCSHGEDDWTQCLICFTVEDERTRNN